MAAIKEESGGKQKQQEEDNEIEVYAGIDTHKDVNVLCVVDSRGEKVAQGRFRTDALGLAALEQAVASAGRCVRVCVEGTLSYGRGIADLLAGAGYDVREAIAPGPRPYSPGGKSDAGDAWAAAMTALTCSCRDEPKRLDGPSEELSALTRARESAVKECTRLDLALQGMAACAAAPLREALAGLGGRRLADAVDALEDEAPAGVLIGLKSMAALWRAAAAERDALERAMAPVAREHYAPLLGAKGVGVVQAAILAASAGANPSRFGSEAAFARHCGAAPLEASSGKVQRHRLSRRGDRLVNRALHQIALVRKAHDPRTKAYVAKKIAEGKSPREALRCLVRYIAREIYRLLLQCEAGASGAPDGPKLKEARRGLGITQRQAGEALGASARKVSVIERGVAFDAEFAVRYEAWLQEQENLKKEGLQI